MPLPDAPTIDPATLVCMDCRYGAAGLRLGGLDVPEVMPAGYVCPHWTPSYWEAQGFQRNWGDAAVMHWPVLEILRKETESRWEYVILCPLVRRPVVLFATKDGTNSWGSF